MQKNKKYVKHETHLEIDSNSRTRGTNCVRFTITEKLKGAEKVAMQVLHVVMTYDCKENTCNEKRIHIIYTYNVYPKILGGQNTLSAHPMS